MPPKLPQYAEGLKDGLTEDKQAAFRTMFVTKTDVERAVRLAEFVILAQDILKDESISSVADAIERATSTSDGRTANAIRALRNMEENL